MTTTKLLTSVAFVALLSLAAAPAHAGQRRGGGGQNSGRSREGAVSRGPSRSAPQARSSSGYRGRPYYSRPYSYSRPYYSFRPRVSLGFGLWMGYPVEYPYYPYPYADPYTYEAAPSYGAPSYPPSSYPGAAYPAYGSSGQGYPAPRSAPSVGMQRGVEQSGPGGISFEITPDTAAVFVDGTYMGTAGQFGATAQPLGLEVGRHHVEIRGSGYRTMTFDVDVRRGQVIPYQGTLQRN